MPPVDDTSTPVLFRNQPNRADRRWRSGPPDQAAAIGTAAREYAFESVGDDADAYAGAIER